jgi:peptide deformylase
VLAYYLPVEDAPRVARVLVNRGDAVRSAGRTRLGVPVDPGLRVVLRHARLGSKRSTLTERRSTSRPRVPRPGHQHEYDHLDGILFLDRMPTIADLYYEEEWDRYAGRKELPVEV